MNIPLITSPVVPGGLVRRTAEPVTFGVPLPRGAVHAPAGWTLRSSSGPAQDVDVHVLDRWTDGSARWVLVDTELPPDTDPARTWTIDTGPSSPGAAAPLAAIDVSELADGVLVDTGAARFTFDRGGRFPFDQVEVQGTRLLRVSGGDGLSVTDATGRTVAVAVANVVVEHRGRRRVSVRVEGTVQAGERHTLQLEARVDCFLRSETVRVRCTVRNPHRAVHPGNFWDLGDSGSILLKDVSLRFGGAAAPTSIRASAEPGRNWVTASSSMVIYQDSSGGAHWNSTNHINRDRRVPMTFQGYRLTADGRHEPGLRATPILVVESGPARISASVPEFWQNCPKALEGSADGVSVRLFPGQFGDLHELQGGEQKTHECVFSFEFDPSAPDTLEWTRNRTVVVATPDWIQHTGAVDFLAPLDEEHAQLVNQAIDGADRFEQKREVIDQFGWRHFGEIYGDHEAIGHQGPAPLVSHYNNQYDPVAGFALQFLRTGDPRWWSAMNELAMHVTDIDIYHTDEDKAAYNGGLFWHTYHYGDADTATHRTYPRKNTGTVHGGGPSADHNYPTGLMLRYFLTGDEASRQAAIGLAQYVLNLDDWRLSPFRWLSHADTGRTIFTPPNFFGPARSSGNSLNALVDGHRLTGDAKFLEKADQLVRRTIHPKDDLQKHRLDEPEYRWFYAMFLQALGKYLSHKAELGLIDRSYAHGRASLLAYARWMAEHEYPYLEKPEKLEYPTETWAAQDIRKSDILYYAAIHASGAERTRFAERALFFHRTSVQTLLGMPTRALARPVIVLLTSGFLKPWFVTHAETVLPAPEGNIDFGSPERFVAQRAQAERRAKLIVAAGAFVAVGAALVALLWWMGRL